MRYFLHLAYNGNAYNGWQRQANTPMCVQQVLEEAISKMTNTSISIMGCGRTDAGVHANQYFVHFDLESTLEYDVCKRLNLMLPPDISVFDLLPIHSRAHARYDAISRSYIYHLHFEKNPFLEPFSSYYDIQLDIDKVQKGISAIREIEDFRYLCLTPDRVKNTICHIADIALDSQKDGKYISLTFTANRFLKSMIRIIVARLLLLGSGKISWELFQDINHGKQQLKYPAIAYPQGLHLTNIVYPYLSLEPRVRYGPNPV